MEPTPNYYKTKRAFLAFVGALLLAIFVGFKFPSGDQRVSVFPFQLEHPELLTHILLVAVLFYLFQFSLQWAAQISEVQRNRFHRIDFVATITISVFAIICYIFWLVYPLVERSGYLSAIFGVFIGFIVVSLLERLALSVGRMLKQKEASEDEQIMRLLKSKAWILNYNPTTKGKEKEITFNEDGTVGGGRNDNEHTWRVRNGLLEIINNTGHVFSRFSYDGSRQMFLHTNDPDTLSIKSQTIKPK